MPEETKLPDWLIVWGMFIVRLAYHFLGGFAVLMGFLQIPFIKAFFTPGTFEKINLIIICLLAPCIVISGGKGLYQIQKIFNNGAKQ